jgi:protease IV
MGLSPPTGSPTGSMRELLAHIRFRGSIRERSVDPVVRLLRAVREKRRIKGVLFDISSGGGGSVPSYDLYAAVKRLAQVKPVVATVGSLAASGGYMAALGARKIYAYPDSGVGSIGVVYPHFAVKGLLDKLGIEVDLIHQGRHKDAFQGYRSLTEEERAKMLELTADDYRGFVELVARERRRSVEEILPLATGEIWSGVRALNLGLVDALGDRETALETLSEMSHVPSRKLVRLEPPRPFMERLLAPGLSSMGESWTASLRDSLEELALDGVFGKYR